jgi:hypothetical protein
MSKKEERRGGHPGAPNNVTSATGGDLTVSRAATEAPRRERHPTYWIHVADDGAEFYYREPPYE